MNLKSNIATITIPSTTYVATAISYSKNMNIKKVIFNDPATIVYWGDGSKTVVKVCEGDTFDAQTGLLLCIAKKIYGHTELKKVLKENLENY